MPRSTCVIEKPGQPAEVRTTSGHYVPATNGNNSPFTSSFWPFVANHNYVPRNVIVFVTGFPPDIDPTLAEAIKAVFELHLCSFYGLHSGSRVLHRDNGTPYLAAFEQNPTIQVVEKYGKPIQAMFDEFLRKHVTYTVAEEVLNKEDRAKGGLRLMVVEPDPSGCSALDAWEFVGVYPMHTGTSNAYRDISSTPPEETVYDIPLHSEWVNYGKDTLKRAQVLLESLNLTGLNQPTKKGKGSSRVVETVDGAGVHSWGNVLADVLTAASVKKHAAPKKRTPKPATKKKATVKKASPRKRK
jgi:hypothetical protein